MSQEKAPQNRWPNKHFWYSIMPLMITLLAIVLINWVWPNTASEPAATRSPVTAVSPQPTSDLTTATPIAILPATILPTLTPTATSLPEPDMTATITLYGPPPESSININGRLAFYWAYAKPLLPGQQFILTLRQNDIVFTTQAIAAPNFGSGFQRMVDLADLPLEPGTAVWQLHLEWQDQKLLASEERTIILLPE